MQITPDEEDYVQIVKCMREFCHPRKMYKGCCLPCKKYVGVLSPIQKCPGDVIHSDYLYEYDIAFQLTYESLPPL